MVRTHASLRGRDKLSKTLLERLLLGGRGHEARRGRGSPWARLFERSERVRISEHILHYPALEARKTSAHLFESDTKSGSGGHGGRLGEDPEDARWPTYSPPIRTLPTDDPMRGFRPGIVLILGILPALLLCQSPSRVVAHYHGQAKAHAGPFEAVDGTGIFATPSTSPPFDLQLHSRISYQSQLRKNTIVSGHTRTPSRTTRLTILRRLRMSTGHHIIPPSRARAKLLRSPMSAAALVVFS